ncbi:Plant intracellular Ras-group-related LRR protein 5 [Hondaea fermentalgiana]|uniref:Plant intracellular Ras-group-related LRR protein 5 n=1 Tax=Hondaea fermentalgiana TaxID=2315210 RepID=A0A2R5G8R6_9STRA|nr:Plant intracellular Ras-group-related LRR protein 5 [Hondaea fermentalgiana]|eukprot:GBG27456.1 Plant intracellular Ras-group-related LRR protein 5 [Hondaea fermentalgiana]
MYATSRLSIPIPGASDLVNTLCQVEHIVRLKISTYFRTSALTSGATCVCAPSPCDGSSTYANCGSGITEGEDRNTDVFEPALSSLTSLTSLSHLSPRAFWDFPNFAAYLYQNKLTELPSSIGALTKLTNLYVKVAVADPHVPPRDYFGTFRTSRPLTSLPETISGLSELGSLYSYSNQLTSLPETISGLSELRVLLFRDFPNLPTSMNDDESSATLVALIVGPLAGAFVAVSVFAAVVIRRRRRAATTKANAVPDAKPYAVPYAVPYEGPSAGLYAPDAVPTAVPNGRADSDERVPPK